MIITAIKTTFGAGAREKCDLQAAFCSWMQLELCIISGELETAPVFANV
jgi:hypothetical protein